MPPAAQDKHFEALACDAKLPSEEIIHMTAQYVNCADEYLRQLCDAACKEVRGRLQDKKVLQRSQTVPSLARMTHMATHTAEAYNYWVKSGLHQEQQTQGWRGHLYLHVQATGLLQAASSSISESLFICLLLGSQESKNKCLATLWRLDRLAASLMWALPSKATGLRLRDGALSGIQHTLSSYWLIQALSSDMLSELFGLIKKVRHLLAKNGRV